MDIEEFKRIIAKKYGETSIYDKVRKYIGEFYNGEIKKDRIIANVVGNHGEYTVSLRIYGEYVDAQCSCYIGKDGCHHSTALAHTFLKNPDEFEFIKEVKRPRIKHIHKIREYLDYVTLQDLSTELDKLGFSEADISRATGTSSAHISAVRRSEARGRYFKELGIIKMAFLWMIDNAKKIRKPEKPKKKSK